MILEEKEVTGGRGGQGQVRADQGQGEGLGFCSPYSEQSLQGLHLSLCSPFSFRKIVLDAGERAEKGQETKRQLSPQAGPAVLRSRPR